MSGSAVWTAAAVSGVRQRRGTAAGVRTVLSTVDTAAACGCPLLNASWGFMLHG